MRLGLVLCGDLSLQSGGFLYDRLLVERLRGRGHEVLELSLPWRSYAGGLADNVSPALLARLAAAPVDLLLQDELAHPSLFLLNHRLRRVRPRPCVAIVHHLRCREARPAWQNALYRGVERRYLASVDACIYNSRDTRRSVERLLPAPKPHVIAPPGGDRFGQAVTPRDIVSRALAPGPLRLLFLGNVIPRKGLHTLLAALATLPRQSWELEVVGGLTADPAYTRAVREQARREGLGGQVRWRGPLEDRALAACLAESHLLAVPSPLEGFGIVYLEAMGFGLPVIAAAAGGAQELVAHGVNGFLVAPEDVAALARHLGLLLQDRQRLAAMGLAARARFLAHPTWADSLDRACRFLEELAGGGP